MILIIIKISIYGGSAWSWNTDRKQFYLHQFSDKQPDFNLRNPEVHEEFYVSAALENYYFNIT